MSDEDDNSIEAGVVLWRRIPPDQVVPDEMRGHRPSKKAFQNASPNYHAQKMLPHGYTHSPAMSTKFARLTTVDDFLQGSDDCFIAGFTVGLVRELNQGILATPLPEAHAHASVTGKKTNGVKRQFAERCAWVKSP